MVKTKKNAFLMSLTSLILCVAMLMGSTLAWFTDTAESKNNKIIAGDLEVDLIMWDNAETSDGYRTIAGEDAAIFGAESLIAQNDHADTLWEPGKTQIVYLGVRNLGNLALKYNIVLNVAGDLAKKLGDETVESALEYAIIDGATHEYATTLEDLSWAEIKELTGVQTDYVKEGSFKAAENGVLDEIAKGVKNETDYFVLAVHMKEDAGNAYKNKDANIDVTVAAVQKNAEKDVFNSDYDVIEFASEQPGIQDIFEAMTKKYEEGTAGTDIPAEIVVLTPVNIGPVEVIKPGDVEPHNYAAEIDGATTTINLMDTLTASGSNRYDCSAPLRIQGQNGRISTVTFKGNENGKYTNVGSTEPALMYCEGKFGVNIESGTYETQGRIIDIALYGGTSEPCEINVSGGTFIFSDASKSQQVNFITNLTGKGFLAAGANYNLSVTGGMFYNCDPTGKVAAGYKVVTEETATDMIYKVVPQ